MMDLVQVFKDMIQAQDKAMELRLKGQDHRFERLRGENLEFMFNEQMKALPRDKQALIIDILILDGYLPGICKNYMESFDGSWGSIKTDFHKLALSILNNIDLKLPMRDVLDLASHNIKHLGMSWDDFYATMKEVRNILKFN